MNAIATIESVESTATIAEKVLNVNEAKELDIQMTAEELFAERPDWVSFYREVLGVRGLARQAFPSREQYAAFEKSESYKSILRMLTVLREQGPTAMDTGEPTRVITVRMPRSLHESLRNEAFDHRTSMNKLCISKLLQYIDGQNVPVEV
jgi:hypothetical protein